MTKNFEMQEKQRREMDEIMLKDYMKLVQEIAMRRGKDEKYYACMARVEELSRRLQEPKAPENLSRKMADGMQFLKNRQVGAWDQKTIDSIISYIFSKLSD